MITVRRAETDADLEAWREVRMAVVPNERAPTVEDMRRSKTPDRLLLLAELDGTVVGSGCAVRSSVAESAAVAPRVLPEMRRRGVGTALLRPLAAHAARLGVANALALVEDEGSAAFARRFGFAEADRQVEQVKILGAEPEPRFPEGVEVTTIAERPRLLEEAFRLAVEAYADMATFAPASITLEEWLREEATHPAGSFVALADGEVVGYAGLMRDGDRPDRAEDGLTSVRRNWRRRGLATALKRAELAWSAAHGLREVYTWTQQGNEAMRRLNEDLGYEYRGVAVTMVAPLPLP
jgi:GNAT superfamily N-acetyltransferase